MSFMLYLLRPETCDISHKIVRERKIKEGCFPTDTYRVKDLITAAGIAPCWLH